MTQPSKYWADMSQAERDAAYDNVAAVANSPTLIAEGRAAAAPYRAARTGHLDLPYGTREREKWDLYPGTDPQAPCLVFIHGGYWQKNTREDFAHLGTGVAAHGWSVAMPGYTLAPDASLTEMSRKSTRRWTGSPCTAPRMASPAKSSSPAGPRAHTLPPWE